MLINGFKPKMTKSSSCRPDVCLNDYGKGLSSFSLSNVLGKLIVNYRCLLLVHVSLGRVVTQHHHLKHIVIEMILCPENVYFKTDILYTQNAEKLYKGAA